jgi:RimJ/RimL family protein N-acetyltransferase
VPTTPLADHGPLPGELVLRDGTPAFVWPLLPTDAKTLRDGFRRLSPDSRRRRFLTSLTALNDAMIRSLVTDVDGVRHIALVLVVLPTGGTERPAGVARLVLDPADPTAADIAVTVADEWQGRGVGSALAAALMARRPATVRRLKTSVAADNDASLALLARLGSVSRPPARSGVVDVTVELDAA